MNKKLLLTSVMSIAMLASITTGATYALFTAESVANVNVTAARVQVEAVAENFKTFSGEWNGTEYESVENEGLVFSNGGFYDSEKNTITNITPMDKITFDLKVKNTSNVKIKYQALISSDKEEDKLFDNLIITINGKEVKETEWKMLNIGEEEVVLPVTIELPMEAGNDLQGLTTKLVFKVSAVQGNANVSTEDKWDGTSDTSWYNESDTEFSLNKSSQIAGLADLVDEGNDFAGKTIKLTSDLNLETYDENGDKICFEPIGSYRNDNSFKGEFDGQNHTISNMAQNTWALDNGYYYDDLGLGLFGKVEDATIKNLVMESSEISGESAICGTVAATAYGDCTFENITVSKSNVADYQYYAGGIVGWASGNHQYINCNIEDSTNIAAQWGDFDNSIGGVIGGAGTSAEILLKDCTISCRIDAYNDVTSSYQWYAYRRAGMLIGNTDKTEKIGNTTYAAAPQLTCENVTVIYGEWANYTYCEFAGKNWPYVRVQAGVSNSAYSNPRYGHPTDANGNEVVDDNHVHNEGEDHNILLTFDQLYGGGQGVYGAATHDGVTVIYNNK